MSTEWTRRFTEAADAYREAFAAVQEHLRSADMGRIPAWCFAVDRMAIEEVEQLSPELGAAELERRRRRVALHALAELIALTESSDHAVPSPDPPPSMPPGDIEADADLDRFITVVNYAKAGGVIYLNGTFEPVRSRGSLPPAANRVKAPGGNTPDSSG